MRTTYGTQAKQAPQRENTQLERHTDVRTLSTNREAVELTTYRWHP